ncbi:MAG: Gfo/Idh/MocA family oxidoreductase [Paenibacillus sp.]|jgi:dihydrodiol dehydrogenase / D-xylose 1-dehydrogenase (NADP)|uniref:Gfo/Idh/MocA family protein n=1 Tax=Paenibacillus sp. TaxID=58172 RepID=UPI002915332E|nr:Gfo/Idh/MocA family oxidoreductase [Paenibacillus sp.]MDU4695388.1 Gfo/Idh/MocA family oxidoreductase [Paenibacillus sp.]
MGEATIKWGILAAGGIAESFAGDLAYAKNGEAYAIGSRNLEKAKAFAEKIGIPKAYGSYEELVADPEVDAVYVATPHPYHKENVLTALRAGKAVLCEKPFTVNSTELEELVAYARERKLFLMEAMWTRFLPVIRRVREWLAAGRIGEVRLVKADFGFRVGWDPAGRLLNPELGGGALLDAGIYPISFASMVLGPHPQHVQSTAHLGETGVDEHFSVLLTYNNGAVASLNGAVRLAIGNDAYIHGTNGKIYVPGFLNATTATLYVDGEEPETVTDDRTFKGYAYEAEAVGRALSAGLTESSDIPLDESLAILRLMDQIRGQWGLKYPFE